MKKIKVICPAKKVTGGPELLHQFCYEARKMGYNAQMVYISKDESMLKDPVAPQYRHYQNPYSTTLNDSSDSIFIIPETSPEVCLDIKKGDKIFWWLSVDNYTNNLYRSRGWDYRDSFWAPLIKKVRTSIGRAVDVKTCNIKYHLVQSYYAWDYCNKIGIDDSKIMYLSDYLNDSYLENAKENLGFSKKNQVLYNPKKGLEFTKRIMAAAPDIKWIPLIHLTYDQMVNFMRESKVYIDFGNHPGKDRIPREAAVNGCCIITGMRGAAAFQKDVDIPFGYKFKDVPESIPSILDKIRDIFAHYDENVHEFEKYRTKIHNEHEQFLTDLCKVCDVLCKE